MSAPPPTKFVRPRYTCDLCHNEITFNEWYWMMCNRCEVQGGFGDTSPTPCIIIDGKRYFGRNIVRNFSRQ
jgi:hypothetical protein